MYLSTQAMSKCPTSWCGSDYGPLQPAVAWHCNCFWHWHWHLSSWATVQVPETLWHRPRTAPFHPSWPFDSPHSRTFRWEENISLVRHHPSWSLRLDVEPSLSDNLLKTNRLSSVYIHSPQTTFKSEIVIGWYVGQWNCCLGGEAKAGSSPTTNCTHFIQQLLVMLRRSPPSLPPLHIHTRKAVVCCEAKRRVWRWRRLHVWGWRARCSTVVSAHVYFLVGAGSTRTAWHVCGARFAVCWCQDRIILFITSLKLCLQLSRHAWPNQAHRNEEEQQQQQTAIWRRLVQ